jgi:hypothetical protein
MIDLALAALATAGVLETLRSHRRLEGVRVPLASGCPVTRYPTLTLVCPIKGLDPGLRENLEAALDHDYPNDVETLFVLDDEHEPALPLVRAAIARHQARGRRAPCLSGGLLTLGDRSVTRTPGGA